MGERIRNVNELEFILPPAATFKQRCPALLHRTNGLTGPQVVIPNTVKITSLHLGYEEFLQMIIRSDGKKGPVALMWPPLRRFLDRGYPGVAEMFDYAFDVVMRRKLERFKEIREGIISASGVLETATDGKEICEMLLIDDEMYEEREVVEEIEE